MTLKWKISQNNKNFISVKFIGTSNKKLTVDWFMIAACYTWKGFYTPSFKNRNILLQKIATAICKNVSTTLDILSHVLAYFQTCFFIYYF